MDPIARTALLTAAERARESRRPDRLFEDPLAELLAGEQGAALADAMPEASRNRIMAIRTRFFDDWLAEVTNQGVHQIVLVAAGMDSRAFRLDWPAGTRLWELDRPELLAAKRELLDKANSRPSCERTEVRVDLTNEGWPARLQRAGFQTELPSAWLAEGLLVYLRAASAERLLRQIAESAAPGSRLGTDFVSKSFLRSPWMQSYLHWLAEQGAPWRFGSDRPEDFLAACGWRATAVRQPGEEGVGAGLLPWPVVPRQVPDIPRSFLVTADRLTTVVRQDQPGTNASPRIT
jgi:methyltransferase (TIGR00027 family)